jgi:serine/threonine protein kinase
MSERLRSREDEPGGDAEADLQRCALLDDYSDELRREPGPDPLRWLTARPSEDQAIVGDLEVIHRLHELGRSPAGSQALLFPSTGSHVGDSGATTAYRPEPTGRGTQALTQAPQQIGRYWVGDQLGEGGQGQVFPVIDTRLGRNLVLKLARRPLEAERAGHERLLREGRLLAECAHPNLVHVVDLDIHEGRPFLVMEHVRGLNLQQHAEQRRPAPRQAARLVAGLAGAVAYIHARGIVHQDIKPANVLIDDGGRPKLIDFGLARLRHAWADDASGSIGGTISYMSPEQALGRHERIGPWTDVFGLGGVLYYLLTGRPVYQSTSEYGLRWQASKGEQVSPRLVNPRLPRALERICLKALAPDPDQRYRAAGDLERSLRRFLARRWIATAALACAALLAVGLLSARLQSRYPQTALNSPAAAPRIVSFDVRHFRGDPPKSLGNIGVSPWAILLKDDVRVLARLDAPAYCYLIALNPDGRVELCFPPTKTESPRPSKDIGYPASASGYFGLTDGLGLQVFALLASRQPLPPFARWHGHAGMPWKSVPPDGLSEGVWRYDGRWIEPMSSLPRSEREKLSDSPRPFREVCEYLKNIPGIDAVEAIAFDVTLPKE